MDLQITAGRWNCGSKPVVFDGCSFACILPKQAEAAAEEKKYILLRKHNSFSVVLLKVKLVN